MGQRLPQTLRWSRSDAHLIHVSLEETVDCQILIKHGAKVNAVDDRGYTPLHEAAYWNRDPKVLQVDADLFPFSFSRVVCSCCLKRGPISMRPMRLEELHFTKPAPMITPKLRRYISICFCSLVTGVAYSCCLKKEPTSMPSITTETLHYTQPPHSVNTPKFFRSMPICFRFLVHAVSCRCCLKKGPTSMRPIPLEELHFTLPLP